MFVTKIQHKPVRKTNSMDSITSFTLIFALLYTFIYVLTSNSRRNRSLKLPPGPPPFPIIGNIHQLGASPHQTLANLSEEHGPLMHLKFGSVNTIVASSPEMAKQILQKHDNVLASRPIPNATHAHNHYKFSMAWMSSNKHWRFLRRICKDHMFSNKTLDSCQGLRQEKMQELHEYVSECSESGQPVNIAEATFTTALNMLSTSMFSMDFASFSSDSTQEFREAVNGLMQVHGTPNLADFFPFLKLIDLQGLMRKSRFHAGKLLAKFDEIIGQRMQLKDRSSSNVVSNDILQNLLNINDTEFSKNDIIHLLMDLFLAGTDTTATTVEWAMAELIRHPEKMEKARNELKNVTNQKTHGQLEESDIPKLTYLQATLKETFRLHPSGPLMLPHKAESEIEINGYVIPKDSQIIVNIYAIGRDAGIWSNVHSFEPERFLDSKIDTKGHDFELIPFGSGRRICPAMPLANRVVPLMIATLIMDFDWKGVEGKLDMKDEFGLTLHKAVPLKAVPIKVE